MSQDIEFRPILSTENGIVKNINIESAIKIFAQKSLSQRRVTFWPTAHFSSQSTESSSPDKLLDNSRQFTIASRVFAVIADVGGKSFAPFNSHSIDVSLLLSLVIFQQCFKCKNSAIGGNWKIGCKNFAPGTRGVAISLKNSALLFVCLVHQRISEIMESKSDTEHAICACVENCKCSDGETEIAHAALFVLAVETRHAKSNVDPSRKVFVAAAKS
ncbi:hypothetical protein CEXT_618691 [Caerostris extrusa]|uniref:Uncharacterized protein n=1 Tax=Caerostris extrusa TaxID=172846 RepID=A0AAV4WZE6_CAEEX|nr:hypothetical protein CEXT_618691 [Caerostris extrusa]